MTVKEKEMTEETTTTAAPKVTAYGTREKETANQVRYSTEWGVVYVPKTQLAKLGNPDRIKLTVEAATD